MKGVVRRFEQIPTEGRYGWEIIGKAQWFMGQGFNMECLMENELAYINYDKPGQITPSYPAQHSITVEPKKGYCIDKGSDCLTPSTALSTSVKWGVWISKW